MADLPELTTKQQNFILRYLINGNNATEAYRSAYDEAYRSAYDEAYRSAYELKTLAFSTNPLLVIRSPFLKKVLKKWLIYLN